MARTILRQRRLRDSRVLRSIRQQQELIIMAKRISSSLGETMAYNLRRLITIRLRDIY